MENTISQQKTRDILKIKRLRRARLTQNMFEAEKLDRNFLNFIHEFFVVSWQTYYVAQKDGQVHCHVMNDDDTDFDAKSCQF